MSDNVDEANELAQLHLRSALSRRPAQASRPFTGKCHWCAEPVLAPQVFCDADCRDDLERSQRRTK